MFTHIPSHHRSGNQSGWKRTQQPGSQYIRGSKTSQRLQNMLGQASSSAEALSQAVQHRTGQLTTYLKHGRCEPGTSTRCKVPHFIPSLSRPNSLERTSAFGILHNLTSREKRGGLDLVP